METNKLKSAFNISMQLLAILMMFSFNNHLSNANSSNVSQINKVKTQPADIKVITDIESWKHPVKGVFKNRGIKVSKVELLKNKTYPIFYVEFLYITELNSENASYYNSVIKDVAKENGYWDFKIIDSKNKLTFTATCNKSRKTVASISANGKKDILKEMINYNKQMQSADKTNKVINYLIKNVPEIEQFKKEMLEAGKGEVTLIVRIDRVPDKYSNSLDKDYYGIYVGENHSDHTVRWRTFYVNQSLTKIMVEDISTGDLITLQQWRKNK